MKKMYIKLLAITVTLLLSVSVVVMSSYAWFVLSGDPAVSGIQVAIGGGNTILVAPDITQVVDGEVCHYPGYFSDTMNFSQFDSYDYLQELGGLTPVSTADGNSWFLPEYYDFSDKEVQEGRKLAGELKDVSQFTLELELQHANLPALEKESIEAGSYVYLDFWVVSPGAGYTLRVSTGQDAGGSFAVDLPVPTADGDGKYTLSEPVNQAGAALRVGFLANPYRLTDSSMVCYQNSNYFDQRYTSLRGIYSEPDSGGIAETGDRFTIYEPNGDYHPTGAAENGTYLHTSPVGVVGGEATAVSVADRLTVQKSSSWLQAQEGQATNLEQHFQTAVFGKDLGAMDTAAISSLFYDTYLQGQLGSYVSKGQFISRTAELYQYSGTVTREQLDALDAAGATEDVFIIQLERNTPQRIRMFIWLEGQDADCVNSVAASQVSVSLELAGSNEDLE